MGKNIFRIILSVCVFTFGISFNCFASDIDSSIDDNAIEVETGEQTDVTGEELSNIDSGAIPLAEESETEEYLTFYPAEKIVSGDATLTDVYNVLAGIHNLFIIAIFIKLIEWSYKIITETYRRFLKNV